MAITAHTPTVKVVGTNGQISLGKQFAGRQVLVEEREKGSGTFPWYISLFPCGGAEVF